ncbi:MAG: carboxylating nicotinate-nucleotide diphosphorylase [Verrucomicrobia bacterium]|nr:carboxylating nicotinate-nucleotide diphosphorylase [Verrucomicrobiota bacterium]MBV8274121.1 carboxylating nicotinate-nucleotide diphosphorylase [Verrucomicrobiota bacterium]
MTFPVNPIQNALAEDIGPGDLTSTFLVPADHQSAARIFAKEDAVVAGTEAARAVYHQVDPQILITVRRQDGDSVRPGDTVLEIVGPTRSILTGERVALNFIQRLSGVATVTRKFVNAVAGTGAEILDTRKTTPGLRALEKAAVKAGGARNHRMGLFDAVVVKDNHLLAHPDLPAAIQAIRRQHPKLLIEIEADSIEQVREFVRLEAIDVILLDNMSPEEIRECVALRRPGLKFEASGGVSLETVRAIAETGVDFISVGQLTHSAPSIDFSLELCAIAK